jgi:hypothetical protein
MMINSLESRRPRIRVSHFQKSTLWTTPILSPSVLVLTTSEETFPLQILGQM